MKRFFFSLYKQNRRLQCLNVCKNEHWLKAFAHQEHSIRIRLQNSASFELYVNVMAKHSVSSSWDVFCTFCPLIRCHIYLYLCVFLLLLHLNITTSLNKVRHIGCSQILKYLLICESLHIHTHIFAKLDFHNKHWTLTYIAEQESTIKFIWIFYLVGVWIGSRRLNFWVGCLPSWI